MDSFNFMRARDTSLPRHVFRIYDWPIVVTSASALAALLAWARSLRAFVVNGNDRRDYRVHRYMPKAFSTLP